LKTAAGTGAGSHGGRDDNGQREVDAYGRTALSEDFRGSKTSRTGMLMGREDRRNKGGMLGDEFHLGNGDWFCLCEKDVGGVA